MKRKIAMVALLVGSAIVGTGVGATLAKASDHDDGPQATGLPGGAGPSDANNPKNLADLYLFREKDQNTAITSTDLIFVMDAGARSAPAKDNSFATETRYQFHVSRVTKANRALTPTGAEDVVLRFEFGAPVDGAQAMLISKIADGTTTEAMKTTGGTNILTTKRGAAVTNNTVKLGGTDITVFAGLREDPFFFDVDRFLLIRDDLAKAVLQPNPWRCKKGATGCTDSTAAVDFTAGLNVLSIVARIPLAVLQKSAEDVFDVWETISVKP